MDTGDLEAAKKDMDVWTRVSSCSSFFGTMEEGKESLLGEAD